MEALSMFEPVYEVCVLGDVMIPMRDGIALATDIYVPIATDSNPVDTWPAILERTPYNKSGTSRSENSLARPNSRTRVEVAMELAAQGFVVVMQDCRGRYGSQGYFTKYVHEAEDGFDTLQWLLEQPWSNGAIGTMGLSYGAHTQCALACLNPPGLACMFIDSGGFSNAYQGGIRRGGAFELKQATWAYKHALLSPESAKDPVRLAALQGEDIAQWYRHMPWTPGNSPLRHAPEYEKYLFEQWQHGLFDIYWQRPGLFAEGYYGEFPDVPVAIIGSWYDPYVRTCIDNFTGLAARKESPMMLVMGPWTHGNRSSSVAGNVNFGARATLDGNLAQDYASMRLEWFHRHLRGDEGSGAPRAPASRQVWHFQMGGGEGERDNADRLVHGGQWLEGAQWPLLGVAARDFYLHGDGEITQRCPTARTAYREYCFDPHKPAPTIGGALTSGEPVMEGGAFDQRYCEDEFGFCAGAAAIPIGQRADVLVFRTPPLQEDMIVTGNMEAQLWVGSDRPDTDFTVKLIDEYPDGYAMNITDGIIRARYREGWDREVFMQAGECYKVTVEPFATSNLFKKGHRLRIDISSSNFPHFDINPNTGGPEGTGEVGVKASNRLYCDAQHASLIRLPIVIK